MHVEHNLMDIDEAGYTSDEKVREKDPEEEQEEWAVARQTSRGETFLEVSSFGNLRDYLGHQNHWTVNNDGYHVVACGNCRCTGMHRLVGKAFVFNPCPELFDEVDHINGVRSDNRWTNLRWTNHRLNMMNTIGGKGWYKHTRMWNRSTNCWYTPKNPYRVCIRDTTVTPIRIVFTGWFETGEEAHAAYLREKSRLFKEEYAALTGFENSGIFQHKADWYETMDLCGPTAAEQGEVSS